MRHYLRDLATMHDYVQVIFGLEGKNMNLYTFGYEGFALVEFIDRLRAAGVKAVVDVRELPLSRKKGFSKQSFAAALRTAGIEYIHTPLLGCPKPIRNRYKTNGNWKEYARAFNEYISTQKLAIRELATIAKRKTICLVCFEADFAFCHRSFVARAAVAAGAPSVLHITAKTMTPDVSLGVAA